MFHSSLISMNSQIVKSKIITVRSITILMVTSQSILVFSEGDTDLTNNASFGFGIIPKVVYVRSLLCSK